MNPYVVLFLVVLAVSGAIFLVAVRNHDERAGKDRSWMIGHASRFVYAIVAAGIAWAFDLNILVGAILGWVAAFAGPCIGFIYALCTSKNGVK